MFKDFRKEKNIPYKTIIDKLKITQATLSYFDTKEKTEDFGAIGEYLKLVRNYGIDINTIFKKSEITIGKQLRELRIAKGLSSQEVADKLDIKQPSLSYIETQKETNILKYLRLLCEYGLDLNKVFI